MTERLVIFSIAALSLRHQQTIMQVDFSQPRQAFFQDIEKIEPTRKACQHMARIQAKGKVQLISQFEGQVEREFNRLDGNSAAVNTRLHQDLFQALTRSALELA